MPSNLAIYAQQHGGASEQFTKAGWQDVTHDGRPAVAFQTATGVRYRFVDDQKPKYDQSTDYKPCWYGLQRAVAMNGETLVDTNGAASVVVAQAAGIPAFSLQAGEETSPPPELIADLKQLAGDKTVIVAFDNDAPSRYAPNGVGHRAAIKRVKLYRANGIIAYALDLGLPPVGSDLADFVKLHRSDSLRALLFGECRKIPIPADPPRRERKAKDYDRDDLPELISLALAALHPERADDREMWREIGMAIKDAIGDSGFRLWDSWSAQSSKYKPRDAERVWNSFKKQGIHIGTLFHYATEDNASWRPYKAPSAHEIKLNAPVEPQDLLDGQERGILAYFGRSGAAVAKLCKATMIHFKAGESFTLKQLSDRSGIKYRKLCVAANTYQGSALLDISATSAHPSDIDSTLVKEKTVGSRTNCSQPGKTPVTYIRPTSAELSRKIFALFVIPLEQRKVYKPLSGVLPVPLKEMPDFQSLVAVERAADIIEDALPDDKRKQVRQARVKCDSSLSRWAKVLSDPAVTAQPAGIDWRENYIGSVAMKNFTKHQGEQQSWKQAFAETGLRRARLARAERDLGITRRATYSPLKQTVRMASELPKAGEWRDEYQGVARAVSIGVSADGEMSPRCKLRMDYHKGYTQSLVRVELKEGRSVVLEYQQGSTLDWMNTEEWAEIEASLALRREKSEFLKITSKEALRAFFEQMSELERRDYVRVLTDGQRHYLLKKVGADGVLAFMEALERKGKPKEKKGISRPKEIIGWTIQDSLDWLTGAELLLKLPAAPELNIAQRLQRIADYQKPVEQMEMTLEGTGRE